jgi:uncharacterized protein YqhQ
MSEEQIIVGGQAVLEGVMMRAPHSYAVAVRRPDGLIVTKGERLPALSDTHPVLKMPILRGAAVLIQSMVLGIKALNFSASVAFEAAQAEEAKEQTTGMGPEPTVASPGETVAGGPQTAMRIGSVAGGAGVAVAEAAGTETRAQLPKGAAIGSIIMALLVNVLIFILLPLLLTNALFVYLGNGSVMAHSTGGAWYAEAWAWLRAALKPVRPSIGFNLVDGMIRMSFFLIMIWTMSLLKDIRRVFEYHGAEHKVVYTWEAGEPLTVENARRKRRQHPRCGTSFLMVVMLVAIVSFSVVKFDSLLLNFATRIALIPVIAGISYEIIRASARRGQLLLSIITRPGLWLQNITTKEPDDSQLEVSIAALQESLKLEPAA